MIANSTEVFQVYRDIAECVEQTLDLYMAHRGLEIYHSKIIEVVSQFYLGTDKKLMVLMPPQSGKSTIALALAAFYANTHQDRHIMLVDGMSRAQSDQRVRGLGKLLPALDRASMQTAFIKLAGKGSIRTLRTGDSVNGWGSDFTIVADPTPNWGEVKTQSMRDRVWEWWQTTIPVRQHTDGKQVLFMHRYHRDDLPGRLLKTEGSEWKVLSLPALCDTSRAKDALRRSYGEPIGGKWDQEKLLDINDTIPEYLWQAMYQQRIIESDEW